jgi:hypothetical protein
MCSRGACPLAGPWGDRRLLRERLRGPQADIGHGGGPGLLMCVLTAWGDFVSAAAAAAAAAAASTSTKQFTCLD